MSQNENNIKTKLSEKTIISDCTTLKKKFEECKKIVMSVNIY